jgi:SPP1 gp7 family putative phage head morphogenesis protein
MAAQPVKALVDDILDDGPFWEEHVQVQVTVVLPLLEQAIEEAGRLGIGLLESEMGLGFDWSLVNEEALRWAREHAGELIKDVTATTQAALRETVSNWIETGEPLRELRKRIETIFEDRSRAEAIATTEATAAYTQGNRVIWNKTGVVDGYEWRTANDELVCVHICRPLHKQRRTLDKPYTIPSGKLQGEQKDGPPGHVRCRCGEAPVVMEG